MNDMDLIVFPSPFCEAKGGGEQKTYPRKGIGARLRGSRANVSLRNCTLDSRFRGNDAPVVMPAPAYARAGSGGHPVFYTGAAA